MTLFRKFDPNVKTQVSGPPPAKAAKAAKEPQTLASLATLADVLSDDKNLPVCIFCKQPVIRGTVGTGALAGEDLHMGCYRRRYPNGHPLKKEER